MKKLMTLIGAAAMAFGLFADPVAYEKSGVSFEATEPGIVGTVFTPSNAVGWTWAPATDLTLGLYDGDAYVYGSGDKARRDGSDGTNSCFTTDNVNNNYLTLESGNEKLVRAIGDTSNVVDQVVKFTGFDEAPVITNGVNKIAVWMSAIETEGVEGDADYVAGDTNLYITVGKLTGSAITPTNLVITKAGAACQLDTWYRLTIKSIGNVFDSDKSDKTIEGFEVYLDGDQVVSDDAKTLIDDDSNMTASAKALMNAGKLFTGLVDTNAKLTSVSYMGMGAVDDLVIDEEGPLFCQVHDVEAYVEVTGADLVAVTNNVTGDKIELVDGKFKVAPGTIVDLYFTAQSGYVLNNNVATRTIDVAGAVDVSADIKPQEAVASVSIAGGESKDYATLAAAYEAVSGQDNAEIAILKNCDYAFVESEKNYLYSYEAGMLIAIEDGAWEIFGNTDGGVITNTYGAAEGKSITYLAGEDCPTPTLVLAGTIADGATITADDVKLLTDETTIHLVGSLVTKVGTFTADNFTFESSYTLSKEGPDDDGYYTYTAEEVASSFEITIDPAIVNGTVTTDPADEAEEGEMVTVTATPNEGYALGTITVVKTASTDPVEVTDGTFTMPGEAVTVSATFTKLGFMVIIAGEPVTTNYFATFAEAVAAATNGETIYVQKNVKLGAEDVTKALTISIDAGVTLTVDSTSALANNLTIIGKGNLATAQALAVSATLDLSALAYAQTTGCTGGFAIAAAGTVKFQSDVTYPACKGAINSAETGAKIIAAGTTYTKFTDDWGTAAVAQIGDAQYSTLAAAVDAAAAGDTVALLANITEDVVIAADDEITLDLGEFDLTSATRYAIKSSGKLTLKGSGTISGTFPVQMLGGTVTINDENIKLVGVEAAVHMNCADGVLNIGGGTFTATDNAVLRTQGNVGMGGNVITVTGGTFNASITSGGYIACAVYAANADTWNLNGGTFNVDGGVGVCARAGIVNIDGATFNVTAPSAAGKVGDKATVISGAVVAYDASIPAYPGYVAATDKIKIDAITIADGGISNVGVYGEPTIQNKSGVALGAPEGYKWDADGKLVKKSYGFGIIIASDPVTTNYYETLASALTEVTARQTIVMLKDVTAGTTEDLTFNANSTLDLGGYTLTVPAAVLSDSKFLVTAGKTVTFTNGTVSMLGNSGRGVQVKGTLNIYNTISYANTGNSSPIVDIFDAGIVNVYDGAVLNSYAHVFNMKKASPNGQHLNVYGGEMNSLGSSKSYSVLYTCYANLNVYLNIVGGTFNIGNSSMTYDQGYTSTLTWYGKLTDTCKAKFSSQEGMSTIIADGYELVKGQDDYYTVQKKVEPGFGIIIAGDPVTTNYYETLSAAITDVVADQTIVMLKDVTTTENNAFTKSCTLDLGGYTLSIPAAYRGKPASAGGSKYTGVNAGATLTVTNGSVVYTGSENYGFYVVGKLINYANWTHNNTDGPAIELYEGAEVVQNAGTLTSGDIFRSKDTDDYVGSVTRTITINGGTMTATGNSGYEYPIIYFTKSGTVDITVNGGTFETALYSNHKTGNPTTIAGLDGDCTAKFKETYVLVNNVASNLSYFVADGYKLKKGGDDYYTVTPITYATVTITPVANCTIAVTNGTTEVTSGAQFDVDDATVLDVYRKPAAGYQLDGCLAYEQITLTTSTNITAAVSKPGFAVIIAGVPTYYNTIEEAIANLSDGATLKVCDNVTLSSAVTFDSKNAILDLGGFTMTGVVACTSSTLVITNGTLDWATGSFTVNSGTVTLAQGATLMGRQNAEPVAINGGTFNIYGTVNAEYIGSFGVMLKNGATVNAYDGCYVVGGNAAFKPKCEKGKSCLNLYGGTFKTALATSAVTYGIIYCTKDNDTTEIKIAGGTFETVGMCDSIFAGCASVIFKDANGEVGLDDTCTATFGVDPLVSKTQNKVTEAQLCKAGYTTKQVGDVWMIVEKTYTVSIAAGIVNGKIETSVTNDVAAATTVVIFPHAASGYTVDKVYTNGQELAAFNETYVFDMPSEDVEVSATFKSAVEPVVPGEPIDCPTANAATNLANTINGDASVKAEWLKAPDGSGATAATYNAYFDAVVVGNSVKFELNELGSETATNKANAAAASIATVLTTDATSATITNPEPGFYYSLKQGTNVTNIPLDEAQKNKLGVAGKSISFNITKDAEAGKGFYQILVTPAEIE